MLAHVDLFYANCFAFFMTSACFSSAVYLLQQNGVCGDDRQISLSEKTEGSCHLGAMVHDAEMVSSLPLLKWKDARWY